MFEFSRRKSIRTESHNDMTNDASISGPEITPVSKMGSIELELDTSAENSQEKPRDGLDLSSKNVNRIMFKGWSFILAPVLILLITTYSFIPAYDRELVSQVQLKSMIRLKVSRNHVHYTHVGKISELKQSLL